MVAKKGKRRMEYRGGIWYWFVRANQLGIPRIHILSEDKRIHLEYPLFDREVPVVSCYVRQLLDSYIDINTETALRERDW